MTPLPQPVAPPNRRPLWHGWWDRLSLYLPVLLMGALALTTYGVLQRLPPPEAPADTPLAAGQPDYRLEGFTLRRYDAEGRLSSTMTGRLLEHFPASQSLTVHDAHLERLDRTDGTRVILQARQLQTDDDRTAYHLSGDARLLREPLADAPPNAKKPRLTLESQSLTWLTETQILETNQPVRLTRGQDVLLADRMRYDERNGTADLRGQVRATLAARTAADQ